MQKILTDEKEYRVKNMTDRTANELHISWIICPAFLCNLGIPLKQISKFTKEH